MSPFTLVLGVTGQPWSARLVDWLADHGDGLRVRDHYVYSPSDALEQEYDALVVEADASLLDGHLVGALRARGRLVVGVHDPALPHAAERFEALGVDVLVTDQTPPGEMAATILRSLQQRRRFETVVEPAQTQSVDDGGHRVGSTGRSRNWRTVVTGACEGAGASELAIALAAALRRRGERVALVDADLVAPCLSQRLRAPLSPNLNTAVDILHQLGDQVADAVTEVPMAGVDLLAGLEHPKNWHDLDPVEVGVVLDRLAEHYQHVVVNVGSALEESQGPGIGRHDLARRLLASADQVLVVVEAGPVGVQRLGRWLVESRGLVEPARCHVVCNRVMAPSARAQLEHEIRRFASPAAIWHLPEDRRVRAASWVCGLVAEGPFTQAVGRVAGGLPMLVAPTRRPWWARLRRTARRRGSRARVAHPETVEVGS